MEEMRDELKMLKDEIENYKKSKQNYIKFIIEFLQNLKNVTPNDDIVGIGQMLSAKRDQFFTLAEKFEPVIKQQASYRADQKNKIAKGRAERQRRTHHLIFLGCLWDDFLAKNNLSEKTDAKIFENVLNQIENVNVSEEYLIFENENFDLPVPAYDGWDKKIIHRYCQIGGSWESFWREICKNDIRDKKIFKIFKQIENENFDVTKMNDDDFLDFKFFCNEKHCQKIGAHKNFFKSRCLKLDEKFFYIFLQQHKNEIIDAITHS